MLVRPDWLLDRTLEWRVLARFIERGQRLGVTFGPRRIGKSYLLDALCEAAGGHRYQAIAGVAATQLHDFARTLGAWLDVGPLSLSGWDDALERMTRLDVPLVVIDELPYLLEGAPELPSVLQRHVDAGKGPALVLAGSSVAMMSQLVAPRAPLFGRSAVTVIPAPFRGADLATLWEVDDSVALLWIDAAVGGLPGYRPLLEPPAAGEGGLDRWMIEEVLAPGSPLLDAAEAALMDIPEVSHRGVYRAILHAIASGERTFSAIARVAGQPTGALTRPLAALERSGLVTRIADPLRARRDTYDLADPHLRTWLSVIAPNRSRLQAGHGREVWAGLRDTTWRSQILGPRWEQVVREYVAHSGEPLLGPIDVVGSTTVSDRSARTSHELDLVAVRGGEIIAIGEAKLRQLDRSDVGRLRRIRELIGARQARIILATTQGVDATARDDSDVVVVEPQDVYG